MSSSSLSSSLVPSTLVLLLLLAAICCLSFARSAGPLKHDTPTCRDEDGNPIDWFIVYKLPKVKHADKPFPSGAGYAYITASQLDDQQAGQIIEDDETFLKKFRQLLHSYLRVPLGSISEAKKLGWTLAKHPIDHEDSMIMRSLALAYTEDKPDSLNWIFYNDHPPKYSNGTGTVGPSQIRAHAKGSILIDDESGDAMLLSHSVPQFPQPVGDKLKFSQSGYRHGQTFVCLNYDARVEGEKVTRHLSNMFALVYNSNITRKLRGMIPQLRELKLEGERSGLGKKDRLASLDQMITTRGGKQFELFSKSSNLEGDMYAGWLASQLESSLFVETWRNGIGDPLGSDCPTDKHQVTNIKDLRLISKSKKLFTWQYFKDHSKWAITDTPEDGVVCLADINRMASQFKRGGGAICLRDPQVWSVFSDTIEDLEPCTVRTKKPSKWFKVRKNLVEKIRRTIF